MRAFAHLFDGKPSGLNTLNILRAMPHLSALHQAINQAVVGDFAAAREAVRVSRACGGSWVCHAGGVPEVWGLAEVLRPTGHGHSPPTHTHTHHTQELDTGYRKIWDFGRSWDPDAYAAQVCMLRGLSQLASLVGRWFLVAGRATAGRHTHLAHAPHHPPPPNTAAWPG
jgi:hypothetical protein